MSEIFNLYCDESCHLEHDHQKAMVLGAIWCPLDKSREIAVRLREINQKHEPIGASSLIVASSGS